MTPASSNERPLPEAGPAAVPAPTARYEMSADLVTLSDARPNEAEAMRTIRTHIVARHMKDGRRGIAICGPGPGVGTTFTATNLAVALAQVGVATLLIDGNMRTPGVERFIKPEVETPGLRHCIDADGPTPTECIHQEVLPNLSVLYSGGHADNAQELLASDNFRRLIDRSLRDYEFTVIDTPPANECADARRISSLIGYTVIVARANVTLTNEVAELADKLQEDGARVVGTVLNEV